MVALLVASCYEQKRYHLPYSSSEIATAGPCIQQCENQAAFAKSDERDPQIFACIAQCKGIQIESGTCGPQHSMPYGYCRSRQEEGDFGPKKVVGFVGGMLLLVVLIVLVSNEVKSKSDD